nr:penicillin-binding transpeptidase domain-containing protein [Colwellia sp. E2M01]
MSEKVSERVNEVIDEVIEEGVNSSTTRNKVTQASSYSEKNEVLLIVNDKRARYRFSPFSTFKIPNSLIALDSELIANAKQKLFYDKEKYPTESWWPSTWLLSDYNLASAFKFSIVPIYRQIANEIGQETMQSYITNFAYGNTDISSGIDDFWLNGSLQISAIEQVEFLQKLNHAQIGVSQQSINTLKEIMLTESTDSYLFYAKTGTGTINTIPVEDASEITQANNTENTKHTSTAKLGWYVGFVENAEGVHYFAFNFTRDSYENMNTERINIVKNHLKKAGVI